MTGAGSDDPPVADAASVGGTDAGRIGAGDAPTDSARVGTESGHETSPPEPGRLLFLAVVPLAVAFVLTILVMIAVALGDPAAPLAMFLDAYGTTIIAAEGIATIVAALVAMGVDRGRTLREQAKRQ